MKSNSITLEIGEFITSTFCNTLEVQKKGSPFEN